MIRRVVLGTLACLAAAAVPSPAQAAFESCGGGSLGLLTTSSSSEHFTAYRDTLGGTDLAAYTTALEAAYDKQVDDFGWPAAPVERIQVVVSGSPAGGGAAATTGAAPDGDNPNTSWDDQDAAVPCLWLATGLEGDALRATAARELARALLHGIGALTPAPDPVLVDGTLALMEEETFPAGESALDDLWPDFSESLGDYDGPSSRSQWLALRGLGEHRGGAAALARDTFAGISSGPATGLDALDAALVQRGTTLAQAFHDYAIAARSMRACPADTPFCFARAEAYLAGAAAGSRADHQTIAQIGEAVEGQIEDDHAIQWIALPEGRADIVVANSSSAGILQASAVCSGASGLVRVGFGSTLAPGAGGVVRAFPPAGCSDPAVVLTTASRTSADPTDSPKRAYVVQTAPGTADLTVALAGTGSGRVTSEPAGIDCASDCVLTAYLDTPVTLTAAPATGSVFAGWGGACSGTERTCTVALAESRGVTATFDQAPATGPGGSGGVPVPPPPAPSFEPPRITGDTTGPRVRISRIRLARNKRSVRVRVTCPATETNRCSGFLTMTARVGRKTIRFGDEAFLNLRGGRSATLKYALTRRSRSLMRRRRTLTVRAVARARDDAFNYATSSQRLRLRVRRG